MLPPQGLPSSILGHTERANYGWKALDMRIINLRCVGVGLLELKEHIRMTRITLSNSIVEPPHVKIYRKVLSPAPLQLSQFPHLRVENLNKYDDLSHV